MKTTLRYIAIIPGAILAYFIAFYAITLLDWLIWRGDFLLLGDSNYINSLIRDIAASAAFVSAGIHIAPNYDKVVGSILALIFTIITILSAIATATVEGISGFTLFLEILRMALCIAVAWLSVYFFKSDDLEFK